LKAQLLDDSSKSCDDGVDHVDVDTHADEEGQGPVVKVIKTCLLSSLTLWANQLQWFPQKAFFGLV
jgi:hypothetical protein